MLIYYFNQNCQLLTFSNFMNTLDDNLEKQRSFMRPTIVENYNVTNNMEAQFAKLNWVKGQLFNYLVKQIYTISILYCQKKEFKFPC